MALPLHPPGPPASDSHSTDPEKDPPIEQISSSSVKYIAIIEPKTTLPNTIAKWNDKIESLAGLEARGITRVLPSERQEESLMGDFQMAFLWFSANITANNLVVGFLGPLVYDLGFVDAALCSVFGGLVGCILTSYMSIWGAQSGSRTMVCALGPTPSDSNHD
jgi:hypothetical protein